MTASILSIGPAQAGEEYHSPSDNVDTGSSVALFDGKEIDLAEGWGEAQACMVWRAAGAVECFRSSAELVEREAEIKAEAGFGAQSMLMACGDPPSSCSSTPTTAGASCGSTTRATGRT
ncbi:MAG: hypothetical protein ACRDZW_05310 [Acidimicrobiales bacterium]